MPVTINQVKQALRDHPCGLTAKELVPVLNTKLGKNLTTKDVNKQLYRHEKELIHEGNLWRLEAEVERSDPFLSKLHGKKEAKEFSLEQFNAIADWKHSYLPDDNPPDKQYITRTGNVIHVDSNYERSFLAYLEEHNLAYAIGGQCVELKYPTHFSTNNSYYPDIFFLSRDNHIAVVEIKPLTAMDYHINISKYKALGDWCRKRGYKYMMLDNTKCFDYCDFYSVNIDPELDRIVSEYMTQTPQKPYKQFKGSDNIVKQWRERFSNRYTPDEINTMLHALVVRKNWYNTNKKNGFCVYSRPVKYSQDGEYEVIEFI